MAKRQRGGTRPGQRPPTQRTSQPASKPAAKTAAPPVPSGSLSADELARAAELEAQIVAEERVATTSAARGRDRRRADSAPTARPRPVGSLTVAADLEYSYVVRDLRKIAVVFVGIFAVLLASWFAIVVLAIVKV